ncbi:GntR family transcriptional regulator [Albidovulum sediminis]|uniref:GntR family transcriptional regulator n=1 Tax=Albidovulum sediminis TaxID=3066345 RepID=A0ABT2NK78_9RHOB|nr:GntR family transcriptional regulator [Defluviimonas sediminis]MCT8329322.1 GntR family transcriptional regulator [Defluviimonas sediminis]
MAAKTTSATPAQRPLTRTEKVHRALRLAILEQRLTPGARLPEDMIGEAFGSSRTIAREALGRLAAEGLVELLPNRGAFVANPTLEEGRGIFAVRAALERAMVRQLAGRIDAEVARTLHEMIEEEGRLAAKSDAEAIRLAGEFHLYLAGLTGNPLLERYLTEVVSRCSLVMAMYGRPHSADCGAREHREIVEAMLAGDFARAGDLMEHHVEEVAARAQLGARVDCDVRAVLADFAAQMPKE